MLNLIAQSLLIATRMDRGTGREKLAEQRRLEDEWFWQGRNTPQQDRHRD
ncbi:MULTISPECIES: hypothetical protein [Gemmobacter]|jgi:hypothetical protein|uniref:Uncharacterized protein n=2 Tax=Gemmobacter TaxID=204456 RepID=A0A2T6ANR0_9RHOB|nr:MULTISPECIES: hypothetical protein [Gemmobacter]PTX45459.1 hypothetical protein C8N34_12241 [Gemmobacter caeni]TWI93626.1 hypothetical protein IQ03_04632 [Gemmobacter caeni]GHC26714.1 hypothetical protein GCM10007291_28330 [Gemmobacter nanjingensis]